MESSTVFYLARHGKAVSNAKDAPLSAEGITQAEMLAEFLASIEGLQIARLISSSYLRAWQTAEIIERKLGIKLEPPESRLREQGVRGFDEEESEEQVIMRVANLMEQLRHSGHHSFLLVTHRLTLTLLLRHYAPEFVLGTVTSPDLYTLTFRDGASPEAGRLWIPNQQPEVLSKL
ncbi:phosphoglycerate mutase family protein [Paenibacillus pinihumi]|uniref:phosphoglycerate mutase family protein n=1 Tax=Paenibacillus pinihumi TaxID=669462 RepID=UPI0003F5AF52|nr:phosphoglycerate mutase family protein [Paenibacillus pinihumi]